MKTLFRSAILLAGVALAVASCTNDFDEFDFADGDAAAGGSTGTGGSKGDAASCGAGLTRCGGTCVDTDSNTQHCGACDAKCPGALTCQNGDCGCSQAAQCGGSGADCRNDRCRCAGDGCRDGEMCEGSGSNAKCSCNGGDGCGGGETCCASGCADLDEDAENCGACGVACPSGQECRSGSCRN